VQGDSKKKEPESIEYPDASDEGIAVEDIPF
jgi:hypothetical protein